jgi:hypothetical protein
MTESICTWIRGCDTCLLIKASNLPIGGLQSLHEIPITCGEQIKINFVTKLPTSCNGNDIIVTIIDRLLNQVQWFVTTEVDLKAERFVLLFLEHYVCVKWAPLASISDRDVRF